MQPNLQLKETTTGDGDFQQLIQCLDDELWNELNEDQATYDRFNKVPGIKTAVVLYAGDVAVACGCFKPVDAETAEIKRMYVRKEHRGKGYAKLVLQKLENWARELGYKKAVLETSIHFDRARRLYSSSGYAIIANYPPYERLEESVCMQKGLQV